MMKRIFLLFSMLAGFAFCADAANDIVLSQRKADNSGFIQRNVAPTARGLLTFDASKIPTSTTDLTYTSPTLSVPDAFAVSSAGSIALTAGGTAKSITASPSTTANFELLLNTSPLAQINVRGLHITGPDAANSGVITDTFGQQTTFLGRRANGTFAVPTVAVAANTLASFVGRGYIGSSTYSGAVASINLVSSETYATGATGAQIDFNTTINQSTNGVVAMRLQNTGSAHFTLGAKTIPAWGAVGAVSSFNAGSAGVGVTITDSSSSGTVATAVANSFAVPTFAASSATTFTNAANLYIAGDVVKGTNVEITNSYGLWNVGKTRLDKPIVRTPSALTYASPTSVDTTLASVYTVTTVNATGSVTFNATTGGIAGQEMIIIITNDATSAKTITFGTNFLPNGTLTPSGVGKIATIQFISNGTNFCEVSRTVLP